jgi:DNA end-binding protein Ku
MWLLVRNSQKASNMPARAIDTATISFGLVSIPIKIYSTSEPTHEIHFHLIHEGCGERLKQQYVCPRHGAVERSEMSKGFELTKGNFIEMSKDELKALEAVASDEVSIREFVPSAAIDPIYVERTYFLGPGKGGERAYRLLRDALEAAELVGVASFAARGKEYVVMVRPFEDGLAMHQLRYPDEIKRWSEVPVGRLPKAAPAELALAGQIVEQLRHGTFDPTQYTDEVKDRVRKLIAKKAKGGEIIAPPEAPKPVVTDLMEALKASLSGDSGDAKPARTKNGHTKTAHTKTARAKNGHGKARGSKIRANDAGDAHDTNRADSAKRATGSAGGHSRGHAHTKTRSTRHAARPHAARSRTNRAHARRAQR